MRIAIGVLVGVTLAACAQGGTGKPSGGGDDDGGSNEPPPAGATLSIDPPMTELVVVNGAAAQATFTATLTAPDGVRRDVTAATRFGVNGDYGAFLGNTVTVGPSVSVSAAFAAGRTQVFADYAGTMASADLIVRVTSSRVDGALPPATAALFAGTDDASLAPSIVYPPADTVMPRNLGDFEVHWTDSHGNDVFEISLRTDLADVRVYVPGGNGLPAQGPTASWRAFLVSEWRAAAGSGNAVTLQVRGVNSAAPGAVGAAPPQTIALSNEDMNGGLYYWATESANNVIGIFRHDMARPGEPAEEFLTISQAEGCVACHVLSRDGTKMAVTFEDVGASAPGPATILDVATKVRAPVKAAWDFATFTPDSMQLLSVGDGVLKVRDAATQDVLATMTNDDPDARVSHPELSPDGTQLAYVYIPRQGWNTDIEFKLGQIHVRSYNSVTHEFGLDQVLVTDGQNNFSPSWSPDGAWIAFNKCHAADVNYDDSASSTWVVKADGSQLPIELARANQAPGLTNSSVRWAPFAQTFGDAKQPMFWLTMSSKRDFGVRLRNTGQPQRGSPGKRAQLWMTPFFPERAALGMDPSVPAFRLPFQNLDSSNQTAQWTERVVTVVP
jgi:cytochrome c551/c552